MNARRFLKRRQRRTDLQPGDRVLITAWPYGAVKGTLVAPTTWLWQHAWIVKLDKPGPLRMSRERVAEDRIWRLPIEP